ncbi:hypothetical protein FXF46_08845 [Gluconobacter thailandicus]|uniref:Uncharacterized protein n=2 Tax=Gluconobacter thailandicus TaxID=257438 RepID=A0AAP9JJ64_GLUTH|nr:hypothetical protein AD940_16185 [Gluconobacter thailandicus]QEH97640.1 hypothetical protein FXF46_08845 [Gluconobacter thailandicus]
MLDPSTLPSVNILGLAQGGAILRAERETPPDGIPAFITKEGWDELIAAHAANHVAPHTVVLPALEKAVARILAHAAKAAQAEGKTAPVISLESDLFPSDPTLILAFVKDETHPVACALIGTAAHLVDMLRGDGSL